MIKKLFIFIIIVMSTSTYAFSKPMCQQLHDKIYNEANYKDVSIYEEQKTIGIRLLKTWNQEKVFKFESGGTYNLPGWELVETLDGYYKVGKITRSNLIKYPASEKIKVGDIILSINDIDLRKFKDDKKKLRILENNVSDLFKEGELIKFKILRKNKDKYKKIIIDRTGTKSKKPNIKNKTEIFKRPFIDLSVQSIIVDEKNETFDATVIKNFYAETDSRHSLSEIVWDVLVKDLEYEDKYLTNFQWYQCPYDEKTWGDLDSIDLTLGYKFDNLVIEDKSLTKSFYNIKPSWELDIDTMMKLKKEKNRSYKNSIYKKIGAEVTYRSTGSYTFKNNFNLKTFPFDKQKLKVFLYNDIYDLEYRRSLISDYSQKEAMRLKESSSISGWHINDVNLKYDYYEDNKDSKVYDGILVEIEISRKSGYYIFKIIFPILLILMICWSAIWIEPKEIESRLTITIVCLLSLIAYNFVIDTDLPKLEYLTIMDYIILISYIYAAIPNFLSIHSFQLFKKNKALTKKYEFYEKRYGLSSYIFIVFLIIVINSTTESEHVNSMFSWAAMR